MVISDKDAFRKAIYDIVKYIPAGRATSYGAIAKAAGYPNLSRMVGAMMGGCTEKGVPAHRVVNSQGYLSGRFAFDTPTKMQELLEAEGVTVVNDKISNWKKVYWDPLKEIQLE
ncbi:methylated-DNA-protein-cysteine methyltransferase-like protein [Dysgonomonas sp. PFB1-18]|uniref:MGMT family protein n=1 Tax=unclassified Dysgonomonas TaxID=2630389 RepID=UPI0024771298|nr:MULTISPECIES: MGMT family protein [unclassified Dysgonomonas]MDH6310862.1 methylated-DNA-protein-cysteine methyltransferase-like protein [Dysgonomonas sp. PF1-14]MDH6340700.1 methylated-DNA-protein-cysteine methyltransferase-like protein [Dysgonomonas sp. PF1-16]MDH6382332.1 methylated-DNA-protein-cysteine methyltransferase-like protein [Dysgonomonas sp. PFB1-18]MDH6399682.1 methylated-DNA-protein-cysteine methyltransferase-like protein [Dysgonomonas sp. PF1-23]